MRLLFVGVFKEEYSTHHPIVKELKRNGHSVYKFDFRYLSSENMKIKNQRYRKFKSIFYFFVSYRLNLPILIRNIKYYFFGNWMMNKQLLNIVKRFKFDVIILGKTEDVNYKIIPKLNKFSKTYYYFMDPLEIAYQINAHKYAKLSNISSATTTVMKYFFKKSGARSFYLLEGYDEKLFTPGEENNNKKIDVLFVGAKFPIREQYVDYLRKNKINVLCHGPGWKNEPIYFEKLVNKYRTSRVVLNFPKEDSGFSDRVFHVLGCGSFMLTKYCSDLPKLFEKETHLDWFNTPEECLKLVNYYLEHEAVRERIAQQGYNYGLKKFTWKKRVEEMLQSLETI